MHAYLNIDHVSITFPTSKGPLNVLNGVNLRVEQGEFISLIGHSGCGKSTVLNIVAGLLQATEGGVVLEGREVTDPGPDRAVVFQNHSLMPWLSVYDNVRLAVDQVFTDKASGKDVRRPELDNLLDFVREGDTLVVVDDLCVDVVRAAKDAQPGHLTRTADLLPYSAMSLEPRLNPVSRHRSHLSTSL